MADAVGRALAAVLALLLLGILVTRWLKSPVSASPPRRRRRRARALLGADDDDDDDE